MKRFILSGSILFLVLLLPACKAPERPEGIPPPPTEEERAPEPEAREERETPNVFYRGIVRPAGISIYMEGSHKLMLPDGRFILLESDALDLNGYVGEEVEAFGAIRPTVEAGGIIMRVEKIELAGKEEEIVPEEGEEETEEEIPEDMEEDESEQSDEEEEEAEPTEEALEEEELAELGEVEEETEAPSAKMQERADAMAQQNLSASNWTQQYCSVHIGFCIPIHRNWWYRSFGATSTSLWHVDLSSEEVASLGDGSLTVRLLSGTVGDFGAAEGQVRVREGTAVGYRRWTENRHFEITAPVALETAVEYITENLAKYEPESEE